MGIFKNIFGKKEQPVPEDKKPTLMQDIVTSKDWIALALNVSQYKADFSLNSLKEIDRFFDEQSAPGGLLSENRGQRLFAIGSYIGEVIISEIGGEWSTDDNDPQGEVNIAVKLPNGGMIWPVQRAIKRFQQGPENSIYDYACVIIQNEK